MNKLDMIKNIKMPTFLRKYIKVDKMAILKTALDGREQEVMHYQINIDNYRLALEHIKTLPQSDQDDLVDFVGQLTGLLASEIIEQKKAKVMLEVIKKQVEAL